MSRPAVSWGLHRSKGKSLDARRVLVFLLLLLLLWLPRGLALDRFVTVDEPKWLVRSASFYNALAHGNFKETFQREHPGVTITWAGTLGFLWRFPGYVKIAPMQTMTPTRFHSFLRSHGVESLDLLVAGRTFVVMGIVVALGLSFLIASRLLGGIPALLAFLFIAFDPFLVAHSRLLHLDGLVSGLMLLSVLAFAAYLVHERWSDLMLSAIAAGLAWLTKSPAFFLLPLIGFLLLVERSKVIRFTSKSIWRIFSPLLAWFGVACVVFVLFWPAMWVDPLGSLGRVFSAAGAYASEGHELSTFFYGKVYTGGDLPWYFYLVAYLWRATPPTLIGLILVITATFLPRWLPMPPEQRRLVRLLLVFALLFAVFMSLGAKKFDRYLLPVFAPLDFVAALGWLGLAQMIQRFTNRLKFAYPRSVIPSLLGMTLVIQAFSMVQTYPYYLTYYNPLLGGHRRAAEVLQVGWGEGLDQAARYLNDAPRNEKTRAVSWYGDGSLSYYFDGTTVPIGLDLLLTDLRRTDYIVLYRNQWQRKLPTAEFIAYFEQLTPEYIVRIDGIEYARIYDLK